MTILDSTANTAGLELPFVGRDRELALLRAASDSAIAGQGSVVLIGGEAGIGKTTLAELLCVEADDGGAVVLTGRCYDLIDTAPYAPWIELFGSYPVDDSLPGIPPTVAHCDIGGGGASQATLFNNVGQFLEEVASRRPLVILLDDQHWADDPSLDLLRYVARQVADLPILILVTYRADEIASPHYLSRLLPLLVRESQVLRINIRPLVSDDLWALIRPRYKLDASDETRLTSFLFDRSEGNPFFAVEVLQTLEEDGVLRLEERSWILGDLSQAHTPILIEHIVAGRLATMNEDDQRLLAIAAVLGQEVPLNLWRDVAAVDEERLLQLVDRASQARILVETDDGRGARFVHALLRQVVYEQQSPALRRRRHQQSGEILATAETPDPDAVAYHFRQSGDPQAVEWLIQAGVRAHRAYSWRAAAERFEAAITALDESNPDAEERGWLLVRLARVQRYATPEKGRLRLDEAGRIARSTNDDALAGWVLWQSGLFRCLEGHIELGLEQLTAGVAAFAALTPAGQARLREFEPIIGLLPDEHNDQGTLAQWLAVAGRYTEAVEYASAYAVETTSGASEASFGDAYVALGSAQAALGHSDESHAAYVRALKYYQDDRHHVHVARALMNELQLRVLRYETDNLTERKRLETEAAIAWAHGSGVFADNLPGAVQLPLNYIEGRWDEAIAIAQALRTHGTLALRAEAARWHGRIAFAQGNTELVMDLFEEWLSGGPTIAPGNSVYRTTQNMQRLAAEVAIDAGELPVARRWLEAYDRWLEWSGAVIGRSESALSWASYSRSQGNLAGALRYAREALEQAIEPRRPLAILEAYRLLGELETETGQYTEAMAHLKAALDLAEACVTPFQQARTLLELARLHLAEGDEVQAAARLATARPIFESLKAAPALSQIEALSARTSNASAEQDREKAGWSSPVSVAPGEALPVELSKREIEVLRLLPDGHTNQEIADLLFLSPKTVENHIGRILAKTDLPNRAAAAAFAVRHDLR